MTERRAKIVTFGVKKGGVGKSTTVVNIAGVAVNRGLKVAILDTDTNDSSSAVIENRNNYRKAQKEQGVKESDLPPYIAVVKKANADTIEDDINHLAAENDLLLIDTKGTESDAFKEAVLSSDVIYLPTGVSVMDMNELTPTIKLINDLENNVKQALKITNKAGAENYGIDARIFLCKVHHHSKDMMMEAKHIVQDFMSMASFSSVVIPYVKKVEQNQWDGLTLSDRGTPGFHQKRSSYELLFDEIMGNRTVSIERE